jgi:hypothetical protein
MEHTVQQKHALNQRGSQRRFRTPDIINVDDLAMMLDEDVINRLNSLCEEYERILNQGTFDPRPWEEEIAYVKRELQIRRVRHDAHVRYVEQMENDYASAEATAPVADLDNSSFLKAFEEGHQ